MIDDNDDGLRHRKEAVVFASDDSAERVTNQDDGEDEVDLKEEATDAPNTSDGDDGPDGKKKDGDTDKPSVDSELAAENAAAEKANADKEVKKLEGELEKEKNAVQKEETEKEKLEEELETAKEAATKALKEETAADNSKESLLKQLKVAESTSACSILTDLLESLRDSDGGAKELRSRRAHAYLCGALGQLQYDLETPPLIERHFCASVEANLERFKHVDEVRESRRQRRAHAYLCGVLNSMEDSLKTPVVKDRGSFCMNIQGILPRLKDRKENRAKKISECRNQYLCGLLTGYGEKLSQELPNGESLSQEVPKKDGETGAGENGEAGLAEPSEEVRNRVADELEAMAKNGGAEYATANDVLNEAAERIRGNKLDEISPEDKDSIMKDFQAAHEKGEVDDTLLGEAMLYFAPKNGNGADGAVAPPSEEVRNRVADELEAMAKNEGAEYATPSDALNEAAERIRGNKLDEISPEDKESIVQDVHTGREKDLISSELAHDILSCFPRGSDKGAIEVPVEGPGALADIGRDLPPAPTEEENKKVADALDRLAEDGTLDIMTATLNDVARLVREGKGDETSKDTAEEIIKAVKAGHEKHLVDEEAVRAAGVVFARALHMGAAATGEDGKGEEEDSTTKKGALRATGDNKTDAQTDAEDSADNGVCSPAHIWKTKFAGQALPKEDAFRSSCFGVVLNICELVGAGAGKKIEWNFYYKGCMSVSCTEHNGKMRMAVSRVLKPKDEEACKRSPVLPRCPKDHPDTEQCAKLDKVANDKSTEVLWESMMCTAYENTQHEHKSAQLHKCSKIKHHLTAGGEELQYSDLPAKPCKDCHKESQVELDEHAPFVVEAGKHHGRTFRGVRA